MSQPKREKVKIKRRAAGLVITPPSPRPVKADDPSRMLFKDAIASAKSSSIEENRTNTKVKSIGSLEKETAPLAVVKEIETLQVFREIKESKGASRRSEESAQHIENDQESTGVFDDYFGQWRPYLPQAQVCVLEALFNMSHALEMNECLTSMPKLAAAAGISERQTYNVVKELEKNGFLERSETFNTPTKKGTIFRLFLTRQKATDLANRRYHFSDSKIPT
jgi:hypothetical protein